ncbi:MAG: isochorismatase family protein [Verrucomicrobiota bacterium]
MARSRSTPKPEAPESAAPGAVLLAVDLQTKLLPTVAGADALASRCRLAIKAAVGLGIPVIFTEQAPDKLGPTAPAIRAAAPDAPVFAKAAFSGLSDGVVTKQLRALGCEHVLICGLETPVCVYQTALNALAEDFQVTVLTDAVGARRPDDAAHCLRSLGSAGVHLLPVETVLYALLHDAGHPFFKTLTQLVKAHA